MKSPNLSNAFLLLSLFFIFISNAFAQIAGGINETTGTSLGGNNFIAGTIFSPIGTPINIRTRIRLSSQTGAEYISTTDDRGQFVFSALAAGNYTVTFDGDQDFQYASQQVEVLQSRGRQTYNISIRLLENKKTTAKPGVINKANIGIPQKALAFYQKALTLSKDGKNQEAIEQLKLAVGEYAKFTMAFNEIAVQYLKLNELEKAEEALQTALKIDSEAFEPMVNYGIVLYRLKKYSESEIALNNVLKLKDSVVGYYYLGRTLTALEKYDDAEKAFLSTIKLGAGEMKEAHRMLASMYITKGDNQKAIEQLTIYLKLVPDAPDAKHLREVIEQLKN
ncbi:MAG: tetratricopeptide repeat protein [Acidobacteriota bacterium]